MNQEMNKIHHRFNVIDFFVIIVLVAVVLSVFARQGITTIVSSEQNDTKIEYTLLLENIPKDYVKAFTVGDEIKLSATDASLGNVTAISEAKKYESYIQMGDGSLRKSEIPDYYTISMTVECSGANTDEGFKLNGNSFIAAGMTMYVYNSNCSVGTVVTSVKEAGLSDVTTD